MGARMSNDSISKKNSYKKHHEELIARIQNGESLRSLREEHNNQ